MQSAGEKRAVHVISMRAAVRGGCVGCVSASDMHIPIDGQRSRLPVMYMHLHPSNDTVSTPDIVMQHVCGCGAQLAFTRRSGPAGDPRFCAQPSVGFGVDRGHLGANGASVPVSSEIGLAVDCSFTCTCHSFSEVAMWLQLTSTCTASSRLASFISTLGHFRDFISSLGHQKQFMITAANMSG